MIWILKANADGHTAISSLRMFVRLEEIFREGQPPPSSPPSQSARQAEKLHDLQKQIMQATWKRIENREMSRFSEDLKMISRSQTQALRAVG